MQAAFRRLPLAATAVFALAMAVSRVADAEFSASATVESEYRFRGVALTDDKPDARIELSYDHPSGAYAGFSLIGGETVHDSFKD